MRPGAATDANAGPSRLLTIQVLRAVAVIFVVISHGMHEIAGLLSGTIVQFNEKRVPGDFGVDLFFVVSGLIMVYVSRGSFGRKGAAMDFLRRRLVRIVPLYWLMTTLMIAVVLILPSRVSTATADTQQWLASYLFIPYARESDGMIRPVLGLGWSLQYEMLFYLLFSIGLLLPMRRALPVTLALIVSVVLVGHWFGDRATLFRFLSHPITFEFGAGILIGWAYVSGIRVRSGQCVAIVVFAVALLALAPTFDDLVDRSRHLHYGVPAALLVVGIILFPGADRHKAARWLVDAGESSYSTYLVHPFVLGLLSLAVRESGQSAAVQSAPAVALFLAVSIAASLVAGHFLHVLVDGPLTRIARRILPSTQKLTSAAAAA